MGHSVSRPDGAELLNDDLKSDDISEDANKSKNNKENINGTNNDGPKSSEYPIAPHLSKELGETVVEVRDIAKQFTIKGREEVIHVLRGVTLARDSEFGPIRRGEFVMIRGPSGGGKTTL